MVRETSALTRSLRPSSSWALSSAAVVEGSTSDESSPLNETLPKCSSPATSLNTPVCCDLSKPILACGVQQPAALSAPFRHQAAPAKWFGGRAQQNRQGARGRRVLGRAGWRRARPSKVWRARGNRERCQRFFELAIGLHVVDAGRCEDLQGEVCKPLRPAPKRRAGSIYTAPSRSTPATDRTRAPAQARVRQPGGSPLRRAAR